MLAPLIVDQDCNITPLSKEKHRSASAGAPLHAADIGAPRAAPCVNFQTRVLWRTILSA